MGGGKEEGRHGEIISPTGLGLYILCIPLGDFTGGEGGRGGPCLTDMVSSSNSTDRAVVSKSQWFCTGFALFFLKRKN